MKFRFVLFPDDEPDANRQAFEAGAARAPAGRQPRAGELRPMPLYEERRGGIVRLADGGRIIPVTNFTARIVSDIVLDDGEHNGRRFGLEVDLHGRKITFSVSALEFGRMAWVLGKLGPEAVVFPGQHQHARAAIQVLSGEICQMQIFANTGWRQIEGRWVYLHAGRALGAEGPVPGVQVALPDQLNHFELALPKDDDELRRAIGATLRLLDAAPDRITIPLVAATFRAALGETDFSVFLTGRTGVFKTALALLAQQHFGARIDSGTLPGNFSSTANALESLAFHAKDTLFVVDDFAPSGGARDADLDSVAERLFRGAGNRQGRSRVASDGRLQPHRPPRALVLGTGEEVPDGHSIRARMLILDIPPGAVDVALLSECQHAADEGLFCQAMAGFVRWVAGRYEQIRDHRCERVRELRAAAHAGGAHARTAAIVADLRVGFEMLLEFAGEMGAVAESHNTELVRRAVNALSAAGPAQAAYQQASDPALSFLALIRAALFSGNAHVADRHGNTPEQPERWGWHPVGPEFGWRPGGVRIGWVDGDHLYLEPARSYRIARDQAGAEKIPISERALRARLHERGLLASVDAARETLKVRRTVEGRATELLHFHVSVFAAEAHDTMTAPASARPAQS